MLYTRNSIGVLSLILVPVLPLLSLLILHLLLHRLSYFLFDLGPDPRAITGTGNTSSDSLTKPNQTFKSACPSRTQMSGKVPE